MSGDGGAGSAPDPALRPQPQAQAQVQVRGEVQVPPLSRTLVPAVAMGLFDVVLNWPVCILLLVFISPLLVLRVAMAWEKPALKRRRVQSLMIYGGVVVMTAIGMHVSARGLSQRTQLLIQAIEDYKTATGGYPDSLEQLVPKQLAAVPTAKRVFLGHWPYNYFQSVEFGRDTGTNRHVLQFVVWPPRKTAYYVFETKEWGRR